MIKVVYHRDLHRVSVVGHAHSGEVGHDLVCASASIIAYTIAYFVENMRKAGQVRHTTIKLEDGDALVSCNPPHRYKDTITLVFDSICGGFELLAKVYPDNISYEIRGK